MIESALILGELGRAVFQEDGRLFMLALEADAQPVPCRRGDLALLLDSSVEIVEFAGERLSLDGLRRDLHSQHSRYRALSFALSGLDSDLQVETRSLCIDAAEEFVQDETVREFVRGRLLGRSVPDGADVSTAIHEAHMLEARHLAAMYEDVERLQPAIRSLLASWAAASGEFFDHDGQAVAEAERVLIDRGVFAGLVSALGSGKEGNLNSAVVQYSLDRDLNHVIPRCAFLLNSIRAQLKLHATLDPVRNAALEESLAEPDVAPSLGSTGETDPIRRMILGLDAETKRGQGKRITALEAKQKVDRQIDELNRALRVGNWDRFEDYLEDLVAFQIARSEPKHLGMTLCSLATSALSVGRLDVADRLANYANDLQVDDAVIWTIRAEVLRSTGSLTQALTAYDEVVGRFPFDVVALTGRAEVLKAMGRLEEALFIYHQIVEQFPADVVARNGRAEVLKVMGRLEEALIAYDGIVEQFPTDVVARNGRAEVLKAMGRLEEALIAYDGIVEQFPTDVVARNGRAEVLKVMGRLEEALIAYDGIVEQFPADVFAWNGRAEVLKVMGRLEEALTAYDRIAEQFPADVVAWNGRAEVLKAMGRLEEALTAYNHLVEQFPTDIVTFTGRAEVLKVLGRLEEALIAYEKLAERFPSNAFVRNGRATVLILRNQIEEARILLTDSEPISESDWIGHHILAMSYLQTHDYDMALERLTFGAEKAPWPRVKRSFETALAVALMRRRDYHQAAKILERELDVAEVARRQLCMVLLAHSQAELGRRAEALDNLTGASSSANPEIRKLTSGLRSFYGFGQVGGASMVGNAWLQQEIEQGELRAILAAA